MKNLMFSILMLSFFMTACSSDDDGGSSCDTSDVAAVIVGSWNETQVAGMGDEVTFNSDMTGSCTEESLFFTELNGDVSTTFSWALNEDNSVLTLDYTNGLGVSYDLTSVECDDLTVEFFGIAVDLDRK